MGGAEVLRLSVLEEMLRRDDLEIRVCVLRDRGVLADRVVQMGIPLDVLGNRGGLLDVAGVLRLAKYLRRHRPDVVQSSQFLTNLHTRLAGWLARTPSVIIEEHGIYGWKRWYHRMLDRWVNGRAQAVVACSHCVARSAASHLGIDESKITVIHNCAAASHFDPLVADAKAGGFDLAGGPSFSVVTVGTLRWEKGHRFLLQAWKQLHDDAAIAADAQLWIVGSGPLESQLRQKPRISPAFGFSDSEATRVKSLVRPTCSSCPRSMKDSESRLSRRCARDLPSFPLAAEGFLKSLKMVVPDFWSKRQAPTSWPGRSSDCTTIPSSEKRWPMPVARWRTTDSLPRVTSIS